MGGRVLPVRSPDFARAGLFVFLAIGMPQVSSDGGDITSKELEGTKFNVDSIAFAAGLPEVFSGGV
jgi:hypothetical protein